MYNHYCDDIAYVHGTLTNSPGLLQVYTVSIAMIRTYAHGMITNSPGLLQVYTVTIAMIGTYVHRMITNSSGAATGMYCHYCNDRDLCSQDG